MNKIPKNTPIIPLWGESFRMLEDPNMTRSYLFRQYTEFLTDRGERTKIDWVFIDYYTYNLFTNGNEIEFVVIRFPKPIIFFGSCLGFLVQAKDVELEQSNWNVTNNNYVKTFTDGYSIGYSIRKKPSIFKRFRQWMDGI